MILKELRLENFRSYEKASVEFSPDQNYFFGKNWQGKSSIMDAIGFAFFGKTIFPSRIAGSAVKVDNIVREGAKKGSVDLTFEHGGKEYNLVRECPDTTVELTCEGKTLGESATTVKEALSEKFGLDNKLFANVFYSEQDDLRRILDSNPEERKVFIEMLLDFGYLKDVKMSAKHAYNDLDDFIEEITSGNIKTVMDLIRDVAKQVEEKEKVVDGLVKEVERESKPKEKVSDISKRLGEGERKTKELLEKKSKTENESDYTIDILKSIKTGKCPTCRQAIPVDLQLTLTHELKDRIAELERKIKTLGTDYSKANDEWISASAAHDGAVTREQRLSDLQFTKRQNELELRQLKTSLEKYEKQYKAFANKKKVLDRINMEKQFLEDFQLAVEGFRDSLRKNMTGDLENGVNHFMSQFTDNDFDAKLRINDEFGFEVMLHNRPSPIFNMSGAAKDILALAIRYGLYRIAARDVNFILFDEPTRHMDSTNTLKLKQAFNEMRDQQVIVITVHDEFFDATGRKFMIEKDTNLCSTLRLMN